ncbi:hypothetical protein PPERSA_12763 [Pseudocohnilembus persalinus]|uniref:Uncharacterized protein n=1 Tax=Pseudocohnilembus persalinus TaxID=266149 RepID=A0A0V0QTR0_PSEPJ|nr:hypothetical protein PPERSA_12763 [Pseudocohnilembus persalinus]|eukprot:KRX05585.1 hypothetical protein PPERSA_12763 [Pseudocohnilembus persalinus]
MLQKNEQITQKAHYIESLQPGYSIKPGQVDQFYTEAYEQQIQEISDLQIKNQTVKIGIDFGNVIVGSDPNANDPDEDTMFGENYLQVKAIPDAIEGVKFLVEKFGADNIYIVSKAKQKMQGKSLNWMQHYDFYNKTGILEKHMIKWTSQIKWMNLQ